MMPAQLTHFAILRIIIMVLLVSVIAEFGCAPTHLSPIPELSDERALQKCLGIYPKSTWRAIHTVEATAPFGLKSSLVGVTIGDEKSWRMHNALLTVEGLVILDVESGQNKKPKINRAMPPLDKPEFIEGLIRDVRLIFFKPEGALVGCGKSPDGGTVCRYETVQKDLIEILYQAKGQWVVRLWEQGEKLTRQVTYTKPKKNGMAQHIRLKSFGAGGYSLDLELLEFESSEVSGKVIEL